LQFSLQAASPETFGYTLIRLRDVVFNSATDRSSWPLYLIAKFVFRPLCVHESNVSAALIERKPK